MLATEYSAYPKVLLVDDDDAVRNMMNAALERHGFEVVAAGGVTEALRLIATECFDVLITDLHMPNAGDGFTLITAMRHSQPNTLTLLLSGYPDVQSAMAAIVLEADQIIVKPIDMTKLAEIVRERLIARKPITLLRKERVATILQRSIRPIVAAWLIRSKQNDDLNNRFLGDEERTGHLPKLVQDLVVRLDSGSTTITGSDTSASISASAHGELRFRQGYTPAMLVQESRILQVTIFETLQSNRELLDFSLLLPDVMTIADEVDSQLTQSMSSYMKVAQESVEA
jgi:ActR/RegA family two-component response regulator